MLWTTAVILIILWMLGLVTGFTGGSFIRIIFVVAVALLVVSLSQEVMINQKLRQAAMRREDDGRCHLTKKIHDGLNENVRRNS